MKCLKKIIRRKAMRKKLKCVRVEGIEMNLSARTDSMCICAYESMATEIWKFNLAKK